MLGSGKHTLLYAEVFILLISYSPAELLDPPIPSSKSGGSEPPGAALLVVLLLLLFVEEEVPEPRILPPRKKTGWSSR